MSSKDNTGYSVGRENGELLLGVRKDSAASLATADGNVTPLQIDSGGALLVSSGGGGVSASISSVVPGTGATNLGKAEDGAHATGHTGVMMLAVRTDSAANRSDTDGDYEPLQMSAGRLWVSSSVTAIVPGTGATNLGKAEDGAHTTADVGVMGLAVRTDTPANRSDTDGDYEPLQIAAGRLWTSATVTALVPGTSATSLGKAEDDAHTSGDVGVMSLAVRKATPANVSGTDGDYEPLQVSAGRLWTSATIDTETTSAISATGSNLDIDTAAEQMTASSITAVKGVVIKAAADNSGILYVGKDNTVTAGTTAATDGYPLSAGDSITLPINNANLVWLIASANNQKVFFLAV